ncbi:hypothetical protein [Mucilaginibacter sp.]
MILLIDLDGTLTDTAHEKFKPLKDGLKEFGLEQIPLLPGALEFIKKIKKSSDEAIIVSDSHPNYVKKISEAIFDLEHISLCDKPNTNKVKEYLLTRSYLINERMTLKGS